jgi:hypothetical protein
VFIRGLPLVPTLGQMHPVNTLILTNVITETKWKFNASKETVNYLQFCSGVESEIRTKDGVLLMKYRSLISAINIYNSHYELTPCSIVLLKMQRITEIVTKFPTFYGTLRFITCSQELAIGPYPEPDASPQISTLFL